MSNEKNRVMASIYRSELRLKSHTHRLEGEHKDQLEAIVSDLETLRRDLKPTEHFGNLE